ncbi:MAG: hypothetical protein IE913_00855 [Halothiobacillus sp.]|nr:hypothetical protein [Halothiobacillus sp.]
MSQWITHIKQLRKPADQVACLIVRDVGKDMQKARRIWLNQATDWLQQTAIPTRGIQQDFTAIRNQLMRYLHWQSTRYEAAMKDWHSSAPQTRIQMQNTLNDLINELRNA